MTGTKTIEGEQRQQAEVLNEKPALHRLQLSLALPVLVSSTHVSVYYSLTPNGNTLIPGTILNPRALPNWLDILEVKWILIFYNKCIYFVIPHYGKYPENNSVEIRISLNWQNPHEDILKDLFSSILLVPKSKIIWQRKKD